MLEQIINTLTSNPLYLVIAVVLSVVILIGVIKKLLKLVLIAAAIFVLYIAYMIWTGQEVPDSIEKVKQSATESVEKGTEWIKKTVEEKADEKLEKLKDGLTP